MSYKSLSVATWGILLLAAGTASAFEVRIDCGGPGCLAEGDPFAADSAYPGELGAGYVSGDVVSSAIWRLIGGSDHVPHLHRYARGGSVEYWFDVQDGTYAVTLYCSEFEVHGPGLRLFDVKLEGATVATDVDLHARAHMFYEVPLRYLVTVTDGVLQVDVGTSTAPGVLAGIAVEDVVVDTVAPGPPELSATGSHGRVILAWDESGPSDLAGARIYRSDNAAGPFFEIANVTDLAGFFWDDDVVDGQTYHYRIRRFDLFGNLGDEASASAVPWPLAASPLPAAELTVDPNDLEHLAADPYSEEYVPAGFSYETEEFDEAGTRYRGGWSRQYGKKNWKVRLDEGTLDDADRLNYNSEFGDFSLLGQTLALRAYEEVRCLSPTAAKVNLAINGEYRGVYTSLEQIDEVFLQRRGFETIGNIYKCNDNMQVLADEETYRLNYEKKTNESTGYDDLIELIEVVNQTPSSAFRDTVFSVFDVGGLLAYYATRIFTGDEDFVNHNHYLYHDLETGIWTMIPWDLDKAFRPWLIYTPIDAGTMDNPINGAWHPLISRVLEIPRCRHRYIRLHEENLDGVFAAPMFEALLDSLAGLVDDDVTGDVWRSHWSDPDLFDRSVDDMKDFRDSREDLLEASYAGFLDGYDGLFINEILPRNATVVVDDAGEHEPYIEIYNGSRTVLPLADYLVGHGEASPAGNQLPDIALNPGEYLLLWADGEPGEGADHLDFSLDPAGGEIVLYSRESALTEIDRLVYPELAEDIAYTSDGDGWYPFFPGEPTPAAPNPMAGQPVIRDLTVDPIFPVADEEIVVTGHAETHDGGPAATFTMRWRVAGTTSFAEMVLHDDGAHGDGAAGDGVSGGVLDPLGTSGVIEFYLSADDAYGATATLPPGAPHDLFTIHVGSPRVLYINEFMADNDNGIVDETGEEEDWLEIYNPGPGDVALGGMFLTDNLDDPTKWEFPDLTLEAGAFLLVWCDDDEEDGPLHTSFGLSRHGEEVGLFAALVDGNAPIDGVVFGPQETDASLARVPDGGSTWVVTGDSTPGDSNDLTPVGDPGLPSTSMVRNHPNPFNPTTTLRFAVAQGGRVELVLYDAAGRRVRRLVSRVLEAGEHGVVWDGTDRNGRHVASGVYHARLVAPGGVSTHKLTLVR